MLSVQRLLPSILQLQTLVSGPFRHLSNPTNLNRSMDSEVNRILSFWFEGPDRVQTWFGVKPALDEEIREKFGDLVKQARTTELDTWTAEPRASLALIILLDQFPRNIWRNTAKAFASDEKALDIASRSIIKSFDREVTPAHQMFFYVPFMHSESVVSQVASFSLLEGALNRVDHPESEDAKLFNGALSFAKAHAVPICRFGRYPSRNNALGRLSTREEGEYLKEFPRGP